MRNRIRANSKSYQLPCMSCLHCLGEHHFVRLTNPDVNLKRMHQLYIHTGKCILRFAGIYALLVLHRPEVVDIGVNTI